MTLVSMKGSSCRSVTMLVALFVALAASAAEPRVARAEAAADAKALLEQARAAYGKRLQRGQAKRAVELFERSIKTAPTFEALWEGARAVAYYGWHKMKGSSRGDRADLYRKGEGWARRAAKMQPNKVAGHFYIAALLGMRVRSQSVFHQMSAAREIRQRAERAVKLDPRFECAGPLRMLGQYYLRLPSAFGGDNNRALKLLERAAKICPSDLDNRVRLAEALHALDQDARAIKELRYVLDHPPTDPHDREDYKQLRREAQELLEDWQ